MTIPDSRDIYCFGCARSWMKCSDGYRDGEAFCCSNCTHDLDDFEMLSIAELEARHANNPMEGSA